MTTGESGAGGEVDIEKIVKMDFPVCVDLPDGGRMIAYYPNATSEQEVIDEVIGQYEKAAPITELAEQTARSLGCTAKQLLEMAIYRIENAEDNVQRTKPSND